jgi:tRNA modification GTPase
MDTIYAVSTGAPPAAIAVLRISGPEAMAVATRLGGTLPPPRRAAVRALRDDAGDLLDRALVLVFPGPRTATGEDLVELHLHGGRAVVRAVEAALAAMPGLRAAEAGEFTRRALTHGRIDLTEAEGLGDLLSAETEAQRRAALRSAEGGLRRQIEDWADMLLGIAADVEALLDHDDEDDVAARASPLTMLHARASALADRIEGTAGQPAVERLRDGLRVVLAGPPNAGKSTLFNALAGRDAAIVSPIAGTTRDRIEAPIVRDGVAYLLIDTAGLASETADPIEAIGISRAQDAMAEADMLLWLGEDEPPAHPHVVALYPKADLRDAAATSHRLPISAASGEGIDRLWACMAAMAKELVPPEDQVALNRRQQRLCCVAAEALRGAALETDLLLLAEQLRAARRALDRITGRADVEAMLDQLFARFCIGK